MGVGQGVLACQVTKETLSGVPTEAQQDLQHLWNVGTQLDP